MITINKPYYKCEHCQKKYFVAHACVKHEDKKCGSNPKNWDACTGCKFAEQTTEEMYFEDYRGEEYSKEVNRYYCTKLNKPMYPFKAVSKDLPNRFPETFEGQEQMPNECELRESIDLFDLFN